MVEKVSGQDVDVFRNNEISLSEIENYDRIILSPGPGLPKDAGLLLPLIKTYAGKKDILGVCLGHQAIAEVFGGKLRNLDQVLHGVSISVKVNQEDALFKDLPATILTGRYHSWVVDHQDFPEQLEITATDEDGNVMAMRHKTFKNLCSVQFHPESVLTPEGEKIIANWLMS
jgi:anthranilate synthase component II